MVIKIRYNTEKEKVDGRLPAWRVLENGNERLADNVVLNTKSWTTMDILESGVTKWHITCFGKTEWNLATNECTITSLMVEKVQKNQGSKNGHLGDRYRLEV